LDARDLPDRVRTLDEARHRLRASRATIKREGVRHVAIFGSFARGDDRPDSDLDVLVSWTRMSISGCRPSGSFSASWGRSSGGPSTWMDGAALTERFRREIEDGVSMPSKRPGQRFRDIVENIDLIVRGATMPS
jgi:hypothetical protein